MNTENKYSTLKTGCQVKDEKKFDDKKNWENKKKLNQKLADYFFHGVYVSDKTLGYIENCWSWVNWATNDDRTRKKVLDATPCNNRFCAVCNTLRSKRDTTALGTVMRYINVEHKKEFIFVTFTAPNVTEDKLKAEINRQKLAFKNLCKRKELLAVNKGYVCKHEITYNKNELITEEMYYGDGKKKKPQKGYFEPRGLFVGDKNPNYNTYHVHLHIVFAVNASYFKDKTYLNTDKWGGLWRSVMKDENINNPDVRRIRTGKDFKNIKEFTKYQAKATDYLINQQVFDVFYRALKGTKLMTYNGLFREGRKKYKAGELDKYKEMDNTEYTSALEWRWWQRLEVYNVKERDFTEAELEKLVSEWGVFV